MSNTDWSEHMEWDYRESYSVWSQHRKTHDRCLYGTYLDRCDAEQVVAEMNCKCPDERYYIKELEE